MASITVTPLNNGIIPSGSLVGMLILNSGTTVSYLYYDTSGNIYYQSNATTPAALILSAGFAITCADFIFDGTSFNIFMGGAGGNYIFGTVDPTGVSTLAPFLYGTTTITAVTFDIMVWGFIVGTSLGEVLKFDVSSTTVTSVIQLTATGVPSGATLGIANIKYDLTFDKHLISCVASTNANPDYSNPTDVAAKAITNFSVVYYGNPIATTPVDYVQHIFTGVHLPLCALGTIEDATGAKVLKLVVAGENCKFYHSDNGTIWALTNLVDQAVQINSLTFNSWVFVGGLVYGIVLMSTNGVVWDSSYDALLYSDIVEVKSA